MTEILLCHLTTQTGPWRVRIDKRHGSEPHHQEHVHITRNRLGGAYSWNKDGTRHDKHRFPASEKHISRAKELAAEALKVDPATLQLITGIESGSYILVAAQRLTGRWRSLLSVYIPIGSRCVLLGAPQGLVFVISDEA